MNIYLNKYLKRLSILFFLIIAFEGNTQENNQKTEIKKSNTETLFTSEEKNYMDKWFTKVISEMGLTEDVKGKYYKIMLENTSKMSALTSKENDVTSEEELKKSLKRLVNKMNLQMKEILNEEQYKLHLSSFDLVVWNIYLRKGWSKD